MSLSGSKSWGWDGYHLLETKGKLKNTAPLFPQLFNFVKVPSGFKNVRGALATLSVEHPTLDCGSGHDLSVCGFRPRIGLCADGTEAAWDSLSHSPSLSALPHLSRKISK